MAEYMIRRETLEDIADVIREKTGSADSMTPVQMPGQIGLLANTAGVTASAADVLEGKSFVDAEGNVIAGTIPIHKGMAQSVPVPVNTNWAEQVVNRTVLEGYYTDYAITATSVGLSVTPTKALQKKRAASGFYHEVRVNPIPDEYQNVSSVTATADDVLAGKVFVDAQGNEIEGTLVVKETVTVENMVWGSTSDGVSNSLAGNGIIRYVTFMNHDGTVEYGRKSVVAGEDCVDPVVGGYLESPTRESSAQYDYTFSGGWATEPNGGINADALKAVAEDRTVYANFAAVLRYYTITFYDSDGTTVLATKSLAYGTVPSYTPTKEGVVFAGWNTEPVAVTGEASYTAVWSEKLTFADALWSDIARVAEAGEASQHFAVGDTRTVRMYWNDYYDNSGYYDTVVEIVGFDQTTLADGTTKAGITIGTKHALRKINFIANSVTSLSAGYANTTIHTDLNEKGFAGLPSDLQPHVKTAYTYGAKLWIPTQADYVTYTYYKTAANRAKYGQSFDTVTDSTVAHMTSTKSSSNQYFNYYVSTAGYLKSDAGEFEYAVILFCI